MVWYWILYSFVLITTALCCVNKKTISYSTRLIFLNSLFVILVLFSGLRGYQVDGDSANYIEWFQEINKNNNIDLLKVKDPAFYVISLVLIGLGFGVSYLFLVYSAIALWVKFKLVTYLVYLKYSHIFLYLYFCRFYFVHDMTQIRTGAAVGLASIALILFSKKDAVLGFLTFLTAIAFHLSVVLMFPFFALMFFGYRFGSRIFLIVIPVFATVFNAYSDFYFDLLGLNEVIRIGAYLSGAYAVQKISLISIYFLARVSVLLWLVCCRWRLLEYFDRLVIFLVMAGIALQIMLVKNDALALRAAEVFAMFDLILFVVPLRFLSKGARLFYYAFLFLLGVVFFMSSLKIMSPYKSIFS